jgi:acetyltransferase
MHLSSLDNPVADEPAHFLRTDSRMRLRLRDVRPGDGRLLATFFGRLSPDDLRFRFVESGRLPTELEIGAMLDVDRRRNEHVLAFDVATGELVASLMVVSNPRMQTAEVAIAVATEWKARGIGWTLLRHARELAFHRGLKRLRSVEALAEHDALESGSALGFRARPLEGDPRLVLVEADLG